MDNEFQLASEDEGSPERPRPPPAALRKNLVQLIETLAHRHSTWRVFSDFVEMAAISMSNAVDLAQYAKREAQYLEVVKRYTREEVQLFPKMLAELTLALEPAPDDVLGRVFHDVELHQKYAGQFFTPDDVCWMMAKMTIADTADLEESVACSSGSPDVAAKHARQWVLQPRVLNAGIRHEVRRNSAV